jgi:hypothetical protein
MAMRESPRLFGTNVKNAWHYLSCAWFEKGMNPMAKSLDAITEVIRDPKQPFRQTDQRPHKAQKHRYERRKIREVLKMSDWASEAAS